MKVFYLDDEPALCELFSDLFSSPDIQIVTFTEPNHAVQACSDSPRDVFFIDMTLGSTTGDKVANTVGTDIIKVLITGSLPAQPGNLFHASFSKPYNMAEIQSFLSAKLATLQ